MRRMKIGNRVTRRGFLAAAAVAGVLNGRALVAGKAEGGRRRVKKPVGLQLWTVRKELAKDIPGTLRRVADIGYQGIELDFPKWPTAAELKKMAGNLGLKIIGASVSLADFQQKFDEVAEYHKELGNTNLTIPYIPGHQKMTDDDWHRVVGEITRVARKCKEAGFRLLYHNHDFEFRSKVGNVDIHEYIFSSIGPDLLMAEIDTYFIQEVGKSPAEYIRKFKGRVPLVHTKDKSKPGEKASNTEVGHGVIDWDAVFAACEEAGVEWYIVEQNCQTLPALESIKVSFEFFKSRGIV